MRSRQEVTRKASSQQTAGTAPPTIKHPLAGLALSLLAVSAPGRADLYTNSDTGGSPDLKSQLCMADAYLLKNDLSSLPKDELNCTANDVEITAVIPTTSGLECTLGQAFTFEADITIQTNANERYDTTFYTNVQQAISPAIVQGPSADNCALLIPKPGEEGASNLDSDVCGDIVKPPDSYTLFDEEVTILCQDADESGLADFDYCAAWDNIERDNCSVEADPVVGQVPNTKSKCNCDSFDIEIFIRPDPPLVTKTLIGPASRNEPGGDFVYNLEIENVSKNPIFVTALEDLVDVSTDPAFIPLTLDLSRNTDGTVPVSLTTNACDNLFSSGSIEVDGESSVDCNFTVNIYDRDLPDDQSIEKYHDVVRLTVKDEKGAALGDGTGCPDDSGSGLGNVCTNELTVAIANVPPNVAVSKTADYTEIDEDSATDVTFTAVLTTTVGSHDDPLTVTSVTDNLYGNILDAGGCDGTSLSPGAPVTCTFTESVELGALESETDTISVMVKDDENDTADASDSHTIMANDLPTEISLVKTANPTSVSETGDDPSLSRTVAYTYTFSNDAAVDDVTFDELLDVSPAGEFDLTGACIVEGQSLSFGITLSPGESASCTIDGQVQGNVGDSWVNVASIFGCDSDNPAPCNPRLKAMDDATVTFTDVPPALTPLAALKATLFIRLTNGGIENLSLDSIQFDGQDVDDFSTADYRVINYGGSFNGISVSGCSAGTVLGYSGSGSDVYTCAFTVEVYPGAVATGEFASASELARKVDIVATDDEGGSAEVDIDVSAAQAAN